MNDFLLSIVVIMLVVYLLPMVSGLAKVVIFTTHVDEENQTLMNSKCFCGALNRRFNETRVLRSLFATLPLAVLCIAMGLRSI